MAGEWVETVLQQIAVSNDREFAIQSMTGTSGRQRVSAEALSHFLTISPSHDLAGLFGRLAQPLFARAHAATEESRSLAALRDALLPKLISGEVRVAPIPIAESA